MAQEKILVVDDESTVRKVIGEILKNEGYEVTEADSGQKALQILLDADNTEPDLILLDIKMPGMDGLDLVKKIRVQFDMPIIMLTAMHDVTLIDNALSVGADDYITKPFRTRELVARIKTKLKRSKT